jgi:hypothetical protein
MHPSDELPFAALLADALAYYRQPVSEFTVSVWWGACQNYSMEQVRKAMTAHATDPDRGQFAPKVADIVRILGGTTTDRAQLAWGKAYEAAKTVGAYSDVVFDDPAIHAAIDDMGGWVKFCRSETKDLSYLQHRFCECHKAYVGRGQFEYPRVLGGDRSSDDAYAKRGLKPPKPTVIGDIDRARLVYRGGAVGAKTAITFNGIGEALGSGADAAKAAPIPDAVRALANRLKVVA